MGLFIFPFNVIFMKLWALLEGVLLHLGLKAHCTHLMLESL